MKLYNEKTHEEVTLPATLVNFRGEARNVVRISRDAEPGKSGKVLTADNREFYPQVFDCYIADEARG